MPLPNSDPFAAVPPLPHEQLRAVVARRRARYLTLGYEPIPIVSGRKRPAMSGWQNIEITLPSVAPWAETYPGALSTGIRTKSTPGFDIDIRDADMADQVQQALLNMLPGGTILKRTGLPPKRLIPCRCTAPFNKISVVFKSPDGVIHKVEVLADGQQFVAEGIHEDTHLPYRWEDNIDLLSIAHEHLPLVNKELAERFIAEASTIMARAGWIKVDPQGRPKQGKTNGKARPNAEPKPNGPYYHFALKDECDALAAAPKGTRNEALNRAAFSLFQLVAGGGLDEDVVRERLFAAAEACGLVPEDGEAAVRATIESGAKAGREQPRSAPDDHNDPAGGDQPDDHNDPAENAEDDDELVIVGADEVEIRAIEWLWPGRFARGKFGLIAGLPDMGKGQIAAFIAAAVTAGIELPCSEGIPPLGNVIWFNAEDSANDTVIPRLIAAGADLKRVKFVSGKGKTFSMVTDLQLLRKAIMRIGNVVVVIIDPVSAYAGVGKVDGRSATDVRSMLTPMKDLAEELQIAIIGIAHFNKKDDVKSALLRVSDSIAWVAAARHVYAVLDDPENKECKLFVKAKNNLSADNKALRYGIGIKTVGRLGDVDIDAPFVVWHSTHVDITANEAMAAAGGHTAKREARGFLLERLRSGPVKADDLIEEAKQGEGISEITLRRAKKELGIKSRKDGFDGAWMWELPRGSSERDDHLREPPSMSGF